MEPGKAGDRPPLTARLSPAGGHAWASGISRVSPTHFVSSGGPRKVSVAGGCECQTPPVRAKGLRGAGFLRRHGGGRRGSGRGSRQPARGVRLLWSVCCPSPSGQETH